MPTPTDQRIEEQVAMLAARAAGDAPAAFIGAVRSKRRAVRARRVAVAGACAAALVALVASLPRAVPEPRAPEDQLVAGAPGAPPALAEGSMLTLRRAWSADAGSGAWLASLPTDSGDTEGEWQEVRVGDARRLLPLGL